MVSGKQAMRNPAFTVTLGVGESDPWVAFRCYCVLRLDKGSHYVAVLELTLAL